MKQSKSEFWSGEEYDAQYGEDYANEISFLRDILTSQQASSLLDVCCGTGIVTIPLSNEASHVVGIDFSGAINGRVRYRKIRNDKQYFILLNGCDQFRYRHQI